MILEKERKAFDAWYADHFSKARPWCGTREELFNAWQARAELSYHPQSPLTHQHQWFRTGAMEPDQMRCIECGAWGAISKLVEQKPALEGRN